MASAAIKDWLRPVFLASFSNRFFTVTSTRTVRVVGAMLHRLRHRGEAALEIRDQIVNSFKPDVQTHRRSARRPLGRGAYRLAIERNDQALVAAPGRANTEQR